MVRRRAKRKRDVAEVLGSGRSEVSPEGGGDTRVPEPSPEPVDAMGWPKSFWRLLGQVDADFDVGDRDEHTSGGRRGM